MKRDPSTAREIADSFIKVRDGCSFVNLMLSAEMLEDIITNFERLARIDGASPGDIVEIAKRHARSALRCPTWVLNDVRSYEAAVNADADRGALLALAENRLQLAKHKLPPENMIAARAWLANNTSFSDER